MATEGSWPRSQRQAGCQRKAAGGDSDQALGLLGWQQGDHIAIFDDTVRKWRCKLCLVTADDKFKGHVKCKGTGRSMGHTLYYAGTFLFCGKCGSFSEARVGNLLERCTRKPANPSAGLRLRLLLAGRNPYTNVYLGEVTRWLVDSDNYSEGGKKLPSWATLAASWGDD